MNTDTDLTSIIAPSEGNNSVAPSATNTTATADTTASNAADADAPTYAYPPLPPLNLEGGNTAEFPESMRYFRLWSIWRGTFELIGGSLEALLRVLIVAAGFVLLVSVIYVAWHNYM